MEYLIMDLLFWSILSMMLWKPVSKVVIIVNKLIPQSYIERLNLISEEKGFELHWIYQEMNSIPLQGLIILSGKNHGEQRMRFLCQI
jgi:hypothetical protein